MGEDVKKYASNGLKTNETSNPVKRTIEHTEAQQKK